jgi:hypothetical protein
MPIAQAGGIIASILSRIQNRKKLLSTQGTGINVQRTSLARALVNNILTSTSNGSHNVDNLLHLLTNIQKDAAANNDTATTGKIQPIINTLQETSMHIQQADDSANKVAESISNLPALPAPVEQ